MCTCIIIFSFSHFQPRQINHSLRVVGAGDPHQEEGADPPAPLLLPLDPLAPLLLPLDPPAPLLIPLDPPALHLPLDPPAPLLIPLDPPGVWGGVSGAQQDRTHLPIIGQVSHPRV